MTNERGKLKKMKRNQETDLFCFVSWIAKRKVNCFRFAAFHSRIEIVKTAQKAVENKREVFTARNQ